LSVGATAPLILRGKVQAASWSPGKGVDETARLPTLLQDLYRNDPLMGPAFARGLETETMAQAAMTAMVAHAGPDRDGRSHAADRRDGLDVADHGQ
jgi:uncharacterized protein (DUF1501 family)